MSIPVVFLHVGESNPVLERVIHQATKQNKVILIGDSNTLYLKDKFGIGFIELDAIIDEDFVEFNKLYEHLSTNPEFIERFCFLRWFAVRNLMEKANIDRVFYADSDVMLYCNVEEENAKYEQFDMTLVHRCCGSTSFFSRKSLSTFCAYLLDIYRDKGGFSYGDLKNKYKNMREHNKDGGVCDMTLLDRFHYEDSKGGGPCRIGEMTHVFDNATYDHNINVDDGVYEHNGRHKTIKFENGEPYCFNKNLNKLVKFNALHFQGPAKLILMHNQIEGL